MHITISPIIARDKLRFGGRWKFTPLTTLSILRASHVLLLLNVTDTAAAAVMVVVVVVLGPS